MSSILFHDDTPFLFGPFDNNEGVSPELRKKRVFFPGAMMGNAGYLGPAYPVILEPAEDEEDEDPNP